MPFNSWKLLLTLLPKLFHRFYKGMKKTLINILYDECVALTVLFIIKISSARIK